MVQLNPERRVKRKEEGISGSLSWKCPRHSGSWRMQGSNRYIREQERELKEEGVLAQFGRQV
ncbi:Hypothetical predicted protein [Xyrichtys novacula]|uniref:Uncharacterized protein n=1 Tax=Xyrichtys novacula TaxID=13765 RepID=A0AAV1FAQ8_XYRNO|nr:Hypothetical predicted protein [Xyrichtys novacula]